MSLSVGSSCTQPEHTVTSQNPLKARELPKMMPNWLGKITCAQVWCLTTISDLQLHPLTARPSQGWRVIACPIPPPSKWTSARLADKKLDSTDHSQYAGLVNHRIGRERAIWKTIALKKLVSQRNWKPIPTSSAWTAVEHTQVNILSRQELSCHRSYQTSKKLVTATNKYSTEQYRLTYLHNMLWSEYKAITTKKPKSSTKQNHITKVAI